MKLSRQPQQLHFAETPNRQILNTPLLVIGQNKNSWKRNTKEGENKREFLKGFSTWMQIIYILANNHFNNDDPVSSFTRRQENRKKEDLSHQFIS